MNTFKAILMICATLSASCSAQYASQPGTQVWAAQLPAASPSATSYVDLGGIKGQSQMPFTSPSQDQFNSPVAGTGTGSRPISFPAATQQICTCITINAGQQTADNTGSIQAVAPVAAPISAPVQQSFVAPAASSSGSQGYVSQSAPAQAGGDNRAPMAAYPTAAAPTANNGEY